MTLTKKQEAFAEEYVLDHNGTQACIRAGYSEATASQMAYKLLRNIEVQKYINGLYDARKYRADVTEGEIIRNMKRLATTSFKDSDQINAWDKLAEYIGLKDKHKRKNMNEESSIEDMREEDVDRELEKFKKILGMEEEEKKP